MTVASDAFRKARKRLEKLSHTVVTHDPLARPLASDEDFYAIVESSVVAKLLVWEFPTAIRKMILLRRETHASAR